MTSTQKTWYECIQICPVSPPGSPPEAQRVVQEHFHHTKVWEAWEQKAAQCPYIELVSIFIGGSMLCTDSTYCLCLRNKGKSQIIL